MINRKNAGTATLIAAIGLAAAFYWWWRSELGALPPYVARANGRIEMTRIEVAVKYAGRVIDLLFREGDAVKQGAVLARQDEAETNARIAGAEAERQRAISAIGKAEADVAVHKKNQGLAQLEWDQAAMMPGSLWSLRWSWIAVGFSWRARLPASLPQWRPRKKPAISLAKQTLSSQG